VCPLLIAPKSMPESFNTFSLLQLSLTQRKEQKRKG